MENVQFKNILIELRESRGYTQEQLAKILNISASTIGMWETGKRTPTRAKYEAIADLFNVDIDYLYGRTNLKRKSIIDEYGAIYSAVTGRPNNSSDTKAIPVYPRVAAGAPVEAIEDAIDTIGIPSSWVGEYYGIRVVGDSMEPKICEGDYVIARSQNDAESGEIVVALINGRDACVKKLIKYPNGSIALQSFNPKYEPMMFDQTEIDSTPVKIIGKVVENRQHY